VQHIGSNLMAPAHVGLGVFHFLLFGHAVAHFKLVQTRLEHLHGFGTVAVLRAVVLALHDNAGGDVRKTHGRVGLVDVLAAGAAGAVGVHAQVGRIDIDFNGVVDLGVDEYAGKRGVSAVGRVERAFAHQAVHTGFGAQQTKGVFTF